MISVHGRDPEEVEAFINHVHDLREEMDLTERVRSDKEIVHELLINLAKYSMGPAEKSRWQKRLNTGVIPVRYNDVLYLIFHETEFFGSTHTGWISRLRITDARLLC